LERDIIIRQDMSKTVNYYGETTGDILINAIGNVKPSKVTSAYKDMAVNKYIASQNYIVFQATKVYAVCDTVRSWDGRKYVILSGRKQDKNTYVYTAVLESSTEGSYSAADTNSIMIRPIELDSAGKCVGLDSDLLDGYEASYWLDKGFATLAKRLNKLDPAIESMNALDEIGNIIFRAGSADTLAEKPSALSANAVNGIQIAFDSDSVLQIIAGVNLYSTLYHRTGVSSTFETPDNGWKAIYDNVNLANNSFLDTWTNVNVPGGATPVFNADWQNVSGKITKYRLNKLGQLILKLYCERTAGATTSPFTLGTGFRPTSIKYVSGWNITRTAALEFTIATTGVITLINGTVNNNDDVYLDVIIDQK